MALSVTTEAAGSGAGEPQRGEESYESRSESRHPRTSTSRQSSRSGISRTLMVTNLSEVPEAISPILMGGFSSVSTTFGACLESPLFSLLHLQCLLSHFEQRDSPGTAHEPQLLMAPIATVTPVASIGMTSSGVPMDTLRRTAPL